MPALLIRHQGVHFEHWYLAFLEHRDIRHAHGALDEVILRDAGNPDDVWVLITWDDLYRAQLFARSEDFQDQLDQSGISHVPDVRFLEVFTHDDLSTRTQLPEGGDLSPGGDDPT
jgi:hypothetical protein